MPLWPQEAVHTCTTQQCADKTDNVNRRCNCDVGKDDFKLQRQLPWSFARMLRQWGFKLKASLSFKLLGKIDGVDVLATEARYHESCRRNYVRRDGRQHHQTGCSDISVDAMTERKAVQWRLRYCMTVWPERTVTVWSGTVVCMYMRHNMYQ